jgi:DNA-directed RNA polymerase subunit omega
MIDALKEEEIVRKVGGRFKLSTLIQKRLAAINAGARALVDIQSDDKMEVVVEEILQNKIYLDSSTKQLKITGESTDVGGPPELDLSSL